MRMHGSLWHARSPVLLHPPPTPCASHSMCLRKCWVYRSSRYGKNSEHDHQWSSGHTTTLQKVATPTTAARLSLKGHIVGLHRLGVWAVLSVKPPQSNSNMDCGSKHAKFFKSGHDAEDWHPLNARQVCCLPLKFTQVWDYRERSAGSTKVTINSPVPPAPPSVRVEQTRPSRRQLVQTRRF
jgi:hypothetical protein